MKISTLPKAREDLSDQVVIGFSLAFDWLRGWPEYSEPIKSEVKQNQRKLGYTFDTQEESAL